TVTHWAHADDEQARRQTYEQAREAILAGRWEDARSLFHDLWKSRRTYDVALQLGQAEYNLKRYRDAAEHLAFGLMLLPPREKAATAERSQQLLTRCKQEVGAIDLRIKNKGADVLVDGQIVAESPLVTEVFVDPGTHSVAVRLSGHQTASFTIQVEAGEILARAVELRPLVAASTADPSITPPGPAQAKGPPSPAAPSPPPSLPSHDASWLPVVAGGALAIAGISSGIGFHLVRGARKDESMRIRDDVPGGCVSPTADAASTCHRLREIASDYDRYGRLELVSFILGGAALLGSGTYFMLYRPDLNGQTTSARRRPLRFDADITTGSAALRIIGEL
ncbi:MAG TPA: PEGA domain-containing protein, partial [Polyangiaceae bacterium]